MLLKPKAWWWCIVIAVVVAALPWRAWAQLPASAPAIAWSAVARYPHDTRHFTQGLIWDAGVLVESIGLYGQSQILKKELATGKVLARQALPAKEFAEGLARVGDEYLQLTWKEGVVRRWSTDLAPRGKTRLVGEGWGLAHDGKTLWLSDGSARLRAVNPKTFKTERVLEVRDGLRPMAQLNELEAFDGALWANLWFSSFVARIHPATGQITGWLDLTALARDAGITQDAWRNGAVLNGMAYRADNGNLLVTGKQWPWIYEIALPKTEDEK